jgi:P-type Cu2+ transporter
VLVPYGVILPPAIAALLMAASTISVAINALLLRRTHLGPTPAEEGRRATTAAPVPRPA